ncbi:hypothetical protein AM493_07685 [Flavobacterium akiainvivens]|uniref:TonB-dependent receptor plug domain-containing protein n=1 Tax=Flavobacterium akiainvivens TaxID=1202724 RepID=A0A0M8MHK1_9FLAO|nr:hypothetical protein [Flavobacterium akiainvivens]KOS05927.1 hypothetical protein AM493_07685 [Flavobacterium akiainvivens]SFQ53328.1 hypothetical protein SAMN05444144_10715 [Flavobacterium akiainvivens]
MKYCLIILLLAHFVCSGQKKGDLYYGHGNDTLYNGINLLFVNDSVVSFIYGRPTVGVNHQFQTKYTIKSDSLVITGEQLYIAENFIAKLADYTFPIRLVIKDNSLIDNINSVIYTGAKKMGSNDPLILFNGKKISKRKLKKLSKDKDFSNKHHIEIIRGYDAYQMFGKESLKGVINIVPKQGSNEEKD